MKTFSAFCAFLTSVVFCANNVLIQSYALHCTDLMLVRSLVQVILCGFLIKTQNIQVWQTQENRLKETCLLILQVS